MSTDKVLNAIKQWTVQRQYDQMADFIFVDQPPILKNPAIIDELIRNLDIQENTVAILYLLCQQQSNALNNNSNNNNQQNNNSSSSSNNNNTNNRSMKQMISQIIEFINDCNEQQIKSAPNHFAQLCHYLTEYLLNEKQPMKGLDPLSRAITKVQLQPNQLTSIHSDLCQLALVSKCLNPALQFLDIDIIDISRENDCYDVKYFLSYYYYGGLIYCIMENYDRSFLFFQTAISITGPAISQITIESFKKYILVSLLKYGKVIPLSKSVTTYLERSVKAFCENYIQLIDAYEKNSVETLNEILEKNFNEFQEDSNVGLIKQVISSLIKVKMQKLTKTFITLSLNDVAIKVGLPSAEIAEKQILQMVEDGEIFATINQKDNMVEFADNPEKYDSLQMYKMIEEQINKCMNLNETLKQLDQDISLNPKFIQKIRAEPNIV